MECMACGSEDNVVVIELQRGGKVAVCIDCRTRPANVGRPSLGITKKVSLTLPEEDWERLDEKANGNRSKFLREVVSQGLGNESEWDNYACLGYAILGAKKMGLSEEETSKLIRSIYSEFDWKSVPDANRIYRESKY